MIRQRPVSLKTILFFLFFLTVFSQSAFGVVPPEINYQGLLTNAAGNPVNDVVEMTFSIYNVASGGTALWTETQAAVEVTNGIYHVRIGSVVSIPFDIIDADLYLGVTVETDSEMIPRQKLTSVPFAMKAQNTVNFGGLPTTGFIKQGELDTITTNMIQNGAVTTVDIQTGAVKSAEIDTDAVGESEIGTGAVRSDEVLDDSLTADDLAENSVGQSELAVNAVGSAEITDGSVASSDVGFNYAASSSKGGPATDVNCTNCISQNELDSSAGDAHSLDAVDGSPPDVIFVNAAGNVEIDGATLLSGNLVLRENIASGDELVKLTRSLDDGVVEIKRTGSTTIKLHGNGNSFFNGGNIGINTGSSTPDFALQVGGVVGPDSDNRRDLGTSAKRWRRIYTSLGVIQSSDIRDKENIEELRYGLSEVLRLRPVSFSWKNDRDSGEQLGLIAQEVQAILSEAVTNGEQSGDTGDLPRLGVTYSAIVPVLIKSLQEQQQAILANQARIKILEAELRRLAAP